MTKVGKSALSDKATLTTAKGAPSEPVGFNFERSSSSSVTISWEAPKFSGGEAITAYLVQYKKEVKERRL